MSQCPHCSLFEIQNLLKILINLDLEKSLNHFSINDDGYTNEDIGNFCKITDILVIVMIYIVMIYVYPMRDAPDPPPQVPQPGRCLMPWQACCHIPYRHCGTHAHDAAL